MTCRVCHEPIKKNHTTVSCENIDGKLSVFHLACYNRAIWGQK